MATGKLVSKGDDQFVLLPKEIRIDADEVFVARHGNMVVLFPKGADWSMLMESLSEFTPDFLANRSQPPEPDVRPDLDAPDATP